MSSLRALVKNNRPLRALLFAVQNAYHVGVARPLGHREHVADTGDDSYFLSAMIRVKDEGRFLPEWIAHHTGLGVEHVYVYDNNSSDDIAHVIEPFLAAGIATYIPWPVVPASPSCTIDFLTRFGHRCEWTAFFDADEFLVELEPNVLEQTLSATSAPAVAVNWRYYGSSGHVSIPSGLVTERFTSADVDCNRHVKVIARPAEIVAYRNSHNFYYRRGRLARTQAGRRVFGSFVTPDTQPTLMLHHYIYRSREDYERKATHGFVDAAGAKDRARHADRADREFGRHNDVHSPIPGDVLSRTASTLRQFGYPSELWGEAPSAGTTAVRE